MEKRYSKPLDIRRHKANWLKYEELKSKQAEFEAFSRFVLTHPDRQTIVSCPLCGSNSFNDFGHSYGVPYMECKLCKHVFAKVMPTPEALSDYYQTEYFRGSVYTDAAALQQRATMIYEPKVRYVTEYLLTTKKRWLDIGAGNGAAVAAARQMGFDAIGIEPGYKARQFARDVLDLELYGHTLEEEIQRSGERCYDIISFFMVLEHVFDPVKEVRHARQLLVDDGMLVIEVPKADSIAAMSDVAFPGQGLRQIAGGHLMNYTLDSINYLLSTTGFEPFAMWFMGQDMFSLLAHFAILEPSFIESRLCNFLIDHNDTFQQVIDQLEACDEVIVLARKKLMT